MAKTNKKNPSIGTNRCANAGPAPAAAPGSARAMAMALQPSVHAAVVASTYGKPIGIGEEDVVALMDRPVPDDLETLATVKNRPVVIARQANINNGGQQQVNNVPAETSGPPRADVANATSVQTELLEASDGERVDAGTTRAASGADPHLVPVEAVDRSADR